MTLLIDTGNCGGNIEFLSTKIHGLPYVMSLQALCLRRKRQSDDHGGAWPAKSPSPRNGHHGVRNGVQSHLTTSCPRHAKLAAGLLKRREIIISHPIARFRDRPALRLTVSRTEESNLQRSSRLFPEKITPQSGASPAKNAEPWRRGEVDARSKMTRDPSRTRQGHGKKQEEKE
jgi:hypothetical protein